MSLELYLPSRMQIKSLSFLATVLLLLKRRLLSLNSLLRLPRPERKLLLPYTLLLDVCLDRCTQVDYKKNEMIWLSVTHNFDV